MGYIQLDESTTVETILKLKADIEDCLNRHATSRITEVACTEISQVHDGQDVAHYHLRLYLPDKISDAELSGLFDRLQRTARRRAAPQANTAVLLVPRKDGANYA